MSLNPEARRAVWLLALGQLLVYSGSYYAFPALLPELEAGTGWSKAVLAAGPTLAWIVMAAALPVSGRLVDRSLGGELLVAGPVLAAVGVAVLGFADRPSVWLAGWLLIGLAQAGSLYETCFAFITRRLGSGARDAITRVTLVAGFAGTLTFPLGHWLGGALGGQGALLVFAAIVLVGVVPANALAVAALRRQARAAGIAPVTEPPGALRVALRRPAFWAISGAVALVYLNHGILLTFILELFADRGAGPTTAAVAAACLGPAQVAGRFALMLAGARVTAATATVLAFGAVVGAGVLLWAAGAAMPLIFLFALLQGAGAGLLSILRPVLTVEVLGRAGFGSVSAAMAIPAILTSALAPSAGALLLGWGGPSAVYAACLGMALAALALGLGIARQVRSPTAR